MAVGSSVGPDRHSSQLNRKRRVGGRGMIYCIKRWRLRRASIPSAKAGTAQLGASGNSSCWYTVCLLKTPSSHNRWQGRFSTYPCRHRLQYIPATGIDTGSQLNSHCYSSHNRTPFQAFTSVQIMPPHLFSSSYANWQAGEPGQDPSLLPLWSLL
jgi:hypothetical protein